MAREKTTQPAPSETFTLEDGAIAQGSDYAMARHLLSGGLLNE